jgi:membrane complex biogenesis BtpA family protein
MLHLLPLPGSPGYTGNLEAIRSRLLSDAEALTRGGVHGLMLENLGDAPFYPRRVPAEVVAHMSALAIAVRERFDLPMGINVLRNDGLSAVAVAQACGAEFIRVNVLCGARLTDQGLIEGIAHDLLRFRARLGAGRVRIFADVNVKHSAPVGPSRPIAEEVADTIERGRADALIASGPGTGRQTDLSELRQIKAAAGTAPVLVGSGVRPETISEYLSVADGFIVGSALKHNGAADNPVDPARVQALMAALGGS